jgi:hypothetical protein
LGEGDRGEKVTVRVDAAAATLRTTPSAIRRAIKLPDFPMPPATLRPLGWTDGQIERLLWAPPDHVEHLQNIAAIASRNRRDASRRARGERGKTP